MLLSGPHDAAPAILEVNAGAGGTDANDWSAMLLRMYLRWADRHGFKAEILDEVEGDVAGIKSATLRVEGKNAYGLLQGEHGVHRVIRLSPYNRTRETSFVGVHVVPEVAKIDNVQTAEKDLKIGFYRLGSQVRNYVFHPYTLVKDVRTAHETGDIVRVMDGEFDDFIDAFLRWQRLQE